MNPLGPDEPPKIDLDSRRTFVPRSVVSPELGGSLKHPDRGSANVPAPSTSSALRPRPSTRSRVSSTRRRHPHEGDLGTLEVAKRELVLAASRSLFSRRGWAPATASRRCPRSRRHVGEGRPIVVADFARERRTCETSNRGVSRVDPPGRRESSRRAQSGTTRRCRWSRANGWMQQSGS